MSPGQTGHITGQMGRVPGTDGTHTRGCPAKILYVYWFFLSPEIWEGDECCRKFHVSESSSSLRMALTASLNCLSCRILYWNLHSLNGLPSLSEKVLFFTDFFVTSLSPNSVPLALYAKVASAQYDAQPLMTLQQKKHSYQSVHAGLASLMGLKTYSAKACNTRAAKGAPNRFAVFGVIASLGCLLFLAQL